MAMHTVNSKDGTSIAYFGEGDRPPLLLVHGTTADHSRWAPLLVPFGEHFSVYAMDRRGRGSSGDASPYAIEREFEDLARVVDAISARTGQPVALVGHSYGAVCSVEAALLTKNLRRLVLYEPPIPTGKPFYPEELVASFDEMTADGRDEDIISSFFLEVARIPDAELATLRSLPNWKARVEAAHTVVREMTLNKTYRFLPEKYANFRVPTLLLLGGASAPLFKAAIDRVAGAISSSSVVVMPGQTHNAMTTAPELFVGEVVRFCSG